MDPRRATGLVVAVALVTGGSFALGRATGDDVTWRSGTAMLGGTETSPQFTATPTGEQDWTYGARGSVPRWVDARGASHAGGWPECLMPPTEQHPSRSQVVPIKFATVSVDEGEFGSGPQVVAVDCQS